jgi:putative SOS response-associated peptidase YedK
MRSIHDRMPVVVPPEAWDRWLDPSLPDPGELHGLLVPAEHGSLKAYRVSRAVNDVRNDGPGLILPLDEAEVAGTTAAARPTALVLPFGEPD